MNTVTRLKATLRQRQRGAVAITLGLTLVVLIGFAGLAIDMGRFFVIKAELQNAMDACALSAASQLKSGGNDANALTRATAYGKVFFKVGVNNAVKNQVNFQSMVPNPDILEITFSSSNAGPFNVIDVADPNTAKYVKCQYPLTDLPIYFMQVLNPLLTTQTVSAMAVAKRVLPTASCIPVALCTDNDAGTGYVSGDWISVVGDKAGPGFFGWVDFDPSGGGSNDIGDILQGSKACNVSEVGALIKMEAGNMAGLDEPWNSRFGWYDKLDKETAPPDKAGFAYSNGPAGNWPSGSNAYSDYQLRRNTFTPYQINVPPGIEDAPGAKKYAPISSSEHRDFGRADRRIVAAPIVNCTKWTDPGGPSVTLPILKWGCVLMLNPYINQGSGAEYQKAKVEFLNLANDANSPCSGGEENAIAPVLTQ